MNLNKKFITYVIIFIIGWFAGSLFILTIITNDILAFSKLNQHKMLSNQITFPRLRKDPTIQVAQNGTLIPKSFTIPSLQFLPPFTLPSISINQHKEFRIYIDWPVDMKLLTNDNYLALETMLAHYPAAIFR